MGLLGLRPASGQYISGDGFRKIADHLYDETERFRPEEVQPDEVVFVNTDLLDSYFELIHPLIKFPYKLITHNSDKNITERELKYLDAKIIKWFAQNVTVNHPKLIPLPIGLENLHYYVNGVPNLFDKFKRGPSNKKPRVLFGFSVSTNRAERQEALNNLEKNPLADKIEGFPLPPQYLSLLNSYQFVASPPGNGLDCHRTWEAMYLGVIPIVKRSVATEYFLNLGLPLLPVENWSDLPPRNGEELSSLYQDIMARKKIDALKMDYWAKLIKQNDGEN